MKKWHPIILLITIFFSNKALAEITATQMGMLDFQVSQNLTTADMNGTNDVTVKLQAAVDAARLANKTLFIPSGTYKVSNTIDCKLDFGGANGWTMLAPVNIVGSKNRPTIVLANSTAGFSGTIPKCIFKYRSTSNNPDIKDPGAVMEGGIRSINFDLGTNNTKAVAVYWACAQYCFIEDIHVEARNGFAGFIGIGGANQLLGNISVNGGQNGIYLPNGNEVTDWSLPGGTCQSTISGCTFTNQTTAALNLWGYGAITMVGITIEKASGDAIILREDNYSPVVQFPFSLIDTKITFTQSNSTNTAIKNLSHMSIALNGVYVVGAGKVVDNNGDENLAALIPITSWTHVARFNYIDKAARSDDRGASYLGTHYNAIGGILSTAAIVQTDAIAPPSDLTSKHIWATTPSFEDPDAVLVPASSTAAQIQAAIDANQKVILAKGTYNLSTPIILKANSIFMGCPGIGLCGSILKNSFTPASATWLINTEDNASATTYLMDITTTTTNIDNLGSLCWRAGSNSIIRTIHLDKGYTETEPNLIRLYFTGNGGGRVFNYQDEKANDGVTQHSGHRKVKISGTSQQLTFYGLNLERGGSLHPVSTWPMLEIVNASNVRIFGAKTEASQPYATINGCNNVFMTNIHDYCATGYGLAGANQIEISGTNDKIELTNLVWIGPPSATWKLVLDPWNTNEPSRQMFLGAYHYNWSTISDVSASPDGQAPTVPTDLTSSAITSTSFTLSWTASTDNVAVIGYDVYKAGVLYGSTASTSISVTGLTASTDYSMTLKAKDAAGNASSASPALTVRTSAGTTLTNIAMGKSATASSFEAGNTVANGNDGNAATRWCSVDGTLNQWWKVDLGATSSITGTEINWEHSNVAYKYKIEISADNTNWTEAVNKTSNTAVGQIMSDDFTASARYVRVTVTGLPIDIWASFYEFKVWGTLSADTQVPTVPTSLTATPGLNTVVLSWAASTDIGGGVTGYKVYNGPTYLATVSGTSTSYTASGLTASTAYTFNVSAIDAAGNESATASVSTTTTSASACTAPYISFVTTAPVIDQTIDAIWASAPIGSITHVTAGVMPSDFAGTQWRTLYDNANLYILVEVKDINKFNESGTDWWEDDVVEIYIDGNNSKGTSYDGVNDFQLAFRYNDVVVGLGANSVTNTTGILFAQQNVTGGYTIEISIPWATIGVTPSADYLLGFDIAVGDDDNGGIRDAQVAAFDSTGNAYQNPSTFGTAVLCGGSAPPPQNLATSGTAYRWSKNTSATANTNKVAAAGLNDGNLVTNVLLNNGVNENANRYEAAGIIWATAKTIGSIYFTNGSWTGTKGSFTAALTVQYTTNGTSWVNASGWTVAPVYTYNSSNAGAIFKFSGPAIAGATGIRVVGQCYTGSVGSRECYIREIEVYASSTKSANIINGLSPAITLDESLNLYPNPVSYHLTIELSVIRENEKVQIYNLAGSLIREFNIASKIQQVNISDLHAGIYILRLKKSSGLSAKFVKQ